MEHKAVYADLFVSSNADPVNQVCLVAESTQGGQKPAVTAISLTNVAGSGALFKEYRLFKYVLRYVRIGLL